jgi:hypothetical protein
MKMMEEENGRLEIATRYQQLKPLTIYNIHEVMKNFRRCAKVNGINENKIEKKEESEN